MKPVGRVILARPYIAGEPLAVSVLKVPKQYFSSILGQVFWIDGLAYKVPNNLNPIKVTGNKLDFLVNNFYMERVK